MTSTLPASRIVAGLAALGVLLLASGCGADEPTERAAERGSSSPQRPAERPDASPSGAPRSPSDAASEHQSGRRPLAQQNSPRSTGNALTFSEVGPDGHLIAASIFGRDWSVTATRGERGRRVSRCHPATMRDVGAQQTRVRDFAGSAGDVRAVQAVSRFVDPRSAWRVEQVVQAWAQECADELRSRDAALGVVRHRAWLSVVEVAGVERPGRQLRRALRAAAATF